jgi:hypothetical protein
VAAGSFLKTSHQRKAWFLAPVVIPASGWLKQHPQGNVNIDPPVLEKIGCIAGTVELLHTNSLLYKTGGMPVWASRRGSGKIPRIFISMRLHDRLFVKEKKSGNCIKATFNDASL